LAQQQGRRLKRQGLGSPNQIAARCGFAA
jgi:hypothetical protein